MKTLTKPLLALRATDLMSSPVVTLSAEMSLQSAAHLLGHAQITGAPVVDREGRLIGVLSATDFLTCCENGLEHSRCHHPISDVYSPWQMLEADARSHDEVRDYMTTDPVTADSHATISELARMMLDAHVHRVIVLDTDRRPVGIVTGSDLFAALAYGD